MLFKDRATIRLERVDSTNNYAANLIKLSAPPEGTVITAQFQTEGRGQRHAHWHSGEGDNLLCSVILYPAFIKSEDQFFISQCIALAVHETIENYLGIQAYIKWPNDIIVKSKKIAGILIEASWIENQISHVIVGVGINLNQQSFDLSTAISTRMIVGKIWDIDVALQSFMNNLEKYYLKLKTGHYSEISKLYRESLYRLEQFTNFLFQGQIIEAKIIGVDGHGKLKLVKADHTALTCDLKEISMIL